MGKINSYLKKIVSQIDQKIYPNRNFVIISNNCWGAEIYKQLNKPYNTPFVGLFLYGPDYLKLLQNFEFYMNHELKFISQSKWTSKNLNYPIGVLGDVEIHFMHYKKKEEADAKWHRRKARMKDITDKSNFYFKFCDRDLTDAEILAAFHKLPFINKISFGTEGLGIDNHFRIEEKNKENKLPDGVKLFRVSHKYIDVLEWINSRVKTTNTYSKLKYLLKLV